jgi:hypothetical protein
LCFAILGSFVSLVVKTFLRSHNMKKLSIVSAALVIGLFLTNCGSPEGGATGWTPPPPIGLSGSVSDTDLENLETALGGAARIQIRGAEGTVLAEVPVGDGGSWAASVPAGNAGEDVTVVLVVFDPDDRETTERVFDAGASFTVPSGGKTEISAAVPADLTAHAVTVPAPAHGSCASGTGIENEIITLALAPDSGYRLKKLVVEDSDNEDVGVSLAGDKAWFTMPSSDVTVTAEFGFPVDAVALDLLVTAPERDAAPDITVIDETQYTGTVAWETLDGTSHSGAFAPETAYRAVVDLTAKDGWTFSEMEANLFGYSGAQVTNAAGGVVTSATGEDAIRVTITFVATAPNDTVDAFDLTGKVTVPVTDKTPDYTGIDTAQYTGTVTWQTGGTAHSGAFAPTTVYRAVVDLTAKTGWTFSGVAAGSFSYSGAQVTNTTGGNTITVTITFNATADTNTHIPIGDPSVKLYLNGSQTPLENNGSTPIAQGTGIFTVGIDDTITYTSIHWYVNDTWQPDVE